MAKLAEYARRRITEWTGEWLKGCVDWLVKEQGGCWHGMIGSDGENNYCVCVGWHDCGTKGEKGPDDDGYRIAWKIGRQLHISVMQCDLDIDFEMPYNPRDGRRRRHPARPRSASEDEAGLGARGDARPQGGPPHLAGMGGGRRR